MKEQKHNDDLVISYLLMRKMLGIIGIALPFILIIGSTIIFNCASFQTSISHYYHTGMRNVFLAALFMISFFLFAYKGYNKDHFYTRTAALLALGIALFPTMGYEFITTPGLVLPDAFQGCRRPALSDSFLYNAIHLFSAAGFFLILAYISIFLFTKSKGEKTPMKKARNRIYRICGGIMIVCVVLIGIYIYLRNQQIINYDEQVPPIFILESLALIAFGTSWLIKGEALLGDRV